MRSVHLSIVVIMTLFLTGIISTAVSLGWELWILPFPVIGTVLSWMMHIGKQSTEKRRLYFYMIVLWLLLVYHGIHATSFHDLASLAAIEFAVLALTEERRLLHIGFALFWFCFFWSGYATVTAADFEADSLFISRVIGNLGVVITTYVVANLIIRKRAREREEDRQSIEALKGMRHSAEHFLANISDALRPPVKRIQSLSSGLSGRPEEAVRADADRILASADALSAQMDELRDVAALLTGRHTTEKEPYRVKELPREVLQSLHLQTRAPELSLKVDTDAALPEVLLGDARGLKKVLYQLLDNALKFTKQGSIRVRIYGIPEDYGINLCMEVTDTGIGMRKETLDAVKRSIYQEEPGTGVSAEGFGLGLQSVYGLVHAMNGFVRMDSTAGKGTQVHVSVPQEIADGTESKEVRHPERPEGEGVFSAEDIMKETAEHFPAVRAGQVLVSSDSACDLPKEWVERLGIAVIRHRLHTDEGSFYDGTEINGDELMRYMRDIRHTAKSEVPDAAAFAPFFEKQLERAKEVLHVSIAEDASPVYREAVQAAKKYERVFVVDSGSMSGGAGLVLLYAALTAARENIGAEELRNRCLRFKKQVRARFILEGTEYLVRGGRMRPLMSRWMNAFLIRPTINMKDDRMKFAVSVGEGYRKRFVRKVLSEAGSIDPSLLLITHAGVPEEELQQIREDAESILHFDRVITLPTSAAVAINVGPGTFGLMFHILNSDRETGGSLLGTVS